MSVSMISDQVDPWLVTSFIAFVSSIWLIAGWLKRQQLIRTGDARKLNHVSVLAGGVAWFHSSDPLRDRWNCHVAVICLFLLLMLVCHWRDAAVFRCAFCGYARESDKPHDAFHVWFSWLVSILGLEIVDLVFGSIDLTRCAALVLGLADAVGEPIGSRFGRRRYVVPDVLGSAPRERSWEGSLAVALVASLVVFISFAPLTGLGTGSPAIFVNLLFLMIALFVGVFVSVVEAWTPHGLDNLTIPVCAAVLLNTLLL